ncbi:fumarylacetoacetate hydrolase family protein [Ferviditalea candida]|uniref:Fumarylacetoacetate hydrolase family protein n=1 Tax=Ferviditalea candida TaxID=3108399 RepID=A0ABU5ZGU6_9BACL|nr:fumarylacetoacetate hydrolase family protein [Paenibacillaceae bacterium T2]
MSKAKIKLRGISQYHEVDVNPADDTVELNGKRYSVGRLPLDSLISGTIYGVLLNYKGAFAALGDAMFEAPYKGEPKAPVMYIKPANTVIGSGMPIPLPADVPELEIGASLGVVMGRTATRVGEAEALEYIAGYTVVNDVSIPHDSVYRPAVSQKCRDGFCPAGPWIIERDAVADPDSLDVRVFINGELRQQNTTANLIRNVPRLIADITEFMTLSSGDVLLVGVPEGAPLVKAGDRVRIEINGVGSLENTVVHEHEWVMEVSL